MRTKEVILYHSADLDGHCSGAIAKLKFPEAELYGMNYGEEIPWEKLEKAHVIMVDFNLAPWSEMRKLGDLAEKVTWIDHHKSAMEEYDDDPPGGDWEVVLERGKAACELCWETFFGGSLPKVVYLLGRYDVWDLEAHPRVLPFQMGMRLKEVDPAKDMGWWRDMGFGRDTAWIVQTAREGQVVLRYQKQCNQRLMRKAFEVRWKGLRFMAVNAGGLNSLAFEEAYDAEKHDAAMSFFYDGGKWIFSLYSPDQTRDLSGIAKVMGGGGHPAACGFSVKNLGEVITINTNERR